jgi:epoxyqueuosine reductase
VQIRINHICSRRIKRYALPKTAEPLRAFGAEWQQLQSPAQGVVSVYARGRDYHKVLRTRLKKLAEQLQGALGTLGYRVFTDLAPVMEVENDVLL